jgi:poly-gamma-glutamate capsule biosynthesis protein CapA/YwtB (metallophosphatase superfamily)
MIEGITIAVSGDAILNRRVSGLKDERFLSLVKLIRSVDVAYTHLEYIIHDYEGPEVYPAAEAGYSWARSPRFVLDELKWIGFDIVSQASNHGLDYMYGGLFSTIKALDEAGIPHAGTGINLGEARQPAYLDTEKGRVALVSMCSSVYSWARAGDARRDIKGRPGVNPLRFYYTVDKDTLKTMIDLYTRLGWWVQQVENEWLFNPAGLHMAVSRFVESDEPGLHTRVDEEDADGNLRAIQEAKRQADWVLVNVHNHEWDPKKGLSAPPEFIPPFARACIDAGADIFIGQGSHAFIRGIEIYKGKPIFYDPGDLFFMINNVSKQPSDLYFRAGFRHDVRDWRCTPTDAYEAKAAVPKALNPSGAYGFFNNNPGCFLPICSLDRTGKLSELRLYPFTLVHKPLPRAGVPLLITDQAAAKGLVEYMAGLSAPFGTQIEFKDGIGIVKL